jgi:3-hydroxyisobutyrate dehydrogenase
MENIKSKKIGWLGLGAMGIPMASRLLQAGFQVNVFNRTRSKEETLTQAGAKSASSPAELMEVSDIVFLMVSDDFAVNEIFKNGKGLLSADVSHRIIINMSTISPEISRILAADCERKNHQYMDAPVSGSIKPAEKGELVIMTGCEFNLHEEMKPLLTILGKKVFHIGNVGSGNSAKLAVNLFLGILTQGLSETILFSRKMGVKPADFIEVLNSGGLSSIYTRIKSEAILEDKYEPAFELRHMLKDLSLAVDDNMDSPLGSVVYNTFKEADHEFGNKDVIAVHKYLERIF